MMRIGMTGLLSVILLAASACQEVQLTQEEKWWLDPPSSATHIAFEKNGKWGYRDRAGKVIVPPRFEYASSFPGKGDILLSYRDKTVHVEVPADPVGRVKMNGQWGYVDAAGKTVIAPRFERVQDFYEQQTAVLLNGKWGYIDRSGKMVIPPQFDEASPFLLNVAHVKKDGRWFTIAPSGRETAVFDKASERK